MMWKLFTAALAITAAAQAAETVIHGSGTTNPSKCYWQIMDKFTTQSKIPVRMTYRAVGSSTGQDEFVAGVTDFASGDLPMTAVRYGSLTTEMMHLPIFIGTVSFFHSIPATENLNLTGELLAKIYMFEIETWDHDEIKAINPHMKLGSNTTIRVARRAEGSSSTNTATEVSSAENVLCFVLIASPSYIILFFI